MYRLRCIGISCLNVPKITQISRIYIVISTKRSLLNICCHLFPLFKASKRNKICVGRGAKFYMRVHNHILSKLCFICDAIWEWDEYI